MGHPADTETHLKHSSVLYGEGEALASAIYQWAEVSLGGGDAVFAEEGLDRHLDRHDADDLTPLLDDWLDHLGETSTCFTYTNLSTKHIKVCCDMSNDEI